MPDGYVKVCRTVVPDSEYRPLDVTVPDLSGGEGEDLLTSDSRQHSGQSAQRLVQHVLLVPWRHLVPPVAHKQGGGRVKTTVSVLCRMT